MKCKEVPMFQTFETLAAAEDSKLPFAIYWHGHKKGYVSGSFQEISNFVPKGGIYPEFLLVGIHAIQGNSLDFEKVPFIIFEAGVSESDAWAQIQAAFDQEEKEKRDQIELRESWNAL
jgi:hypothetical protein